MTTTGNVGAVSMVLFWTLHKPRKVKSMSFKELQKVLDPDYRRMTKRDFVNFCSASDGRTKVGGPTGKGRITAKRALALLGVAYA